MTRSTPWLAVYGFGAHIKSTPKKLTIIRNGSVEEYPINEIKHLLVVGGHQLHSTTIAHLLQNGSYLSFFEPDGTPVGTLEPYEKRSDRSVQKIQENIPRYKYATRIAQTSLKSRIMAIEKLQEQRDQEILYEGELQILHNSLSNLEYLVKLEEIRRLLDLGTSMYYEILARDIPKDLNFKRRIIRPQCDPVNALLSIGYAMLFGNTIVSVIGAGLDPNLGLLNEGQGSLIRDFMEPYKATMIDPLVCKISRESLNAHDFEVTPTRCILSDSLIKAVTPEFRAAIDKEKIDSQVHNFLKSLQNLEEFTIMY